MSTIQDIRNQLSTLVTEAHKVACALDIGDERTEAFELYEALRRLQRQGAAGNSPVIPDGWVMLPAEPTQAMMNAWLSEVANWRGHAAGYRAMIAAAPQQEVTEKPKK